MSMYIYISIHALTSSASQIAETSPCAWAAAIYIYEYMNKLTISIHLSIYLSMYVSIYESIHLMRVTDSRDQSIRLGGE